MRSPDATTHAGACLARIAVLEARRMSRLMADVQVAHREAVRAILMQQRADAVSFARRVAP